MIIDFWVENYLSIRDRQYLSFIAKGHESECVVKMSDGTLLYKLAILFGANASGKTNILTAIEEIFGLMTIPNMGIKQNIDSHEPFCLTKDEPTKMHISFYVDDKRYDYDIDYDQQHILSEKLYYYPNKTKALFYKRTFIDKDIQPSIKFGRSLRLNKTAQTSLKENTLNNQSVLSSCKKISFNESMKPFIMLRSGIEKYYNTINGKETLDIKARLEDVCANEHKRKFFLLMLKKSDFNITDFRVVAKNSVLSEDIREQIQELNISESVKRQFLDTEIDDVIFKHSSQNGSFDVSLDQQSKGTISFLQTLNTLYEIINENRICFIDELEEDLHPDLLMYYLKVFLFNSSKSQLIVTSQVLSLLSDDFLNENRGFVWLVEKNLDTASSKYTRGDFLGLHKNVSIYKSYKNGHLGAKPKLDSFFIDLDS